ncbi:Daunorubicin/doxorubicin resistance ATP-binding protein DrrA [Salinivirga cyanobacteriivorans]|uniref:Daunorubicin/doxorubicin resistance ATP-binding protein DrrA n=1 Tax=Salinivirga cyanobacteriivorans TaxID=1307839 RepID=A0A0S2I167_9BACT|nr:ABC transporter ATP-binding protein [Salinivirga cyanobacteriivorans]ALO15995.1 Daunorubicin/doxorubicin resistance ATP-binding protein DrrA [Salinivirga cyanobacteriivorans]
MQTVIETHDLTFNFKGKKKAVDELSLKVPEGSIYGFLGPNGAGKSTTIRMLSGLLFQAQGTIELFGKNLKKSRKAALKNSAFMIEEPTIYKHLTGKQNLELLCKAGGYKKSRIDEVLRWVNLFEDRNRKAGNYSMGMKQRLGIAGALLPDPELFILDEPTNGLDPQGMYEIRELIVELNREQGKTIFISSHLLGEIEKMCTHVGIIHHGKGIFEGTIDELATMTKTTKIFRIETTDAEKAIDTLKNKWKGKVVEKTIAEFQPDSKANQQEIIQTLIKANIPLSQAYEVKNNLEELFMQVTEK